MVDPIKVIKGLLGAEQDLADFIQNGPNTGFPGYVRDGFRHRCNEFANLPPWARALSGVAGGSIDRFCTPYWEDNMWDGPELAPPPFTGGQCEGVGYRVIGTYNEYFSDCATAPRSFNLQVIGPVGGLVRQGVGDPDCAAQGATARGWGINTGNGVAGLTGIGVPGVSTPVITSVNREDGLPDDCGDLPTEPAPGPNPPPDPGPLPGPEPTDNPDPDNPIPFFPLPPFNDPVFGPQPITGPSDGFDPTPSPNPTAGGDGLPGDGGAIGGAAGEVNGNEPGQDIDFGPPPEGRIWVGCIVDLIVDSRIGNIPGTGPQSTVWPSVRGNVALKYSTLYGSSQRINSRYTELFRPNTALTVTGCFLQVQPGGSGLVFPISALTCPETPCGE